MNDITSLSQTGLPSSQSLVKATAVAIAVSLVLLLIAVLPAEYGIDPTGLGKKMGLTALAPTETVVPESAPLAVSDFGTGPLWRNEAVYKSDAMEITLQPGEGTEIKALMKAGERFMYSWEAKGGAVNFDMHGEPPNAAQDEFTSYWKGRDQFSDHGYFEAPIDGTHGWYWRNRGAEPVVVQVKVSGYYEKLYQP